MKKEFYIIIPYDHNENRSVKDTSMFWVFTNFWQSINGSADILKIKNQIRNFWQVKKWLTERSNAVKTWLENIWIRWEVIEKSELVTFLADYYNPSLDNLVTVKDISNYNLTN
jgi:hypothetical protein